MRYAIFTDIHANLEALETVLARIDELALEQPIDQIWFLGDLVGYGPNPNECIEKLRARTDVIIAGNHDWAAVGKLDLDDFSAAARISAEWTAKELTPEHRDFLRNLPERLEMGECTLVHGSPYGPLWEYLTSEVLAERSFQYFNSRFCIVGHTHVPVIFQQPYTLANEPTEKLDPIQEDTAEMSAIVLTSQQAEQAESALRDAEQEASTQAALATFAEEAVTLTHLNGKTPAETPETPDEQTAGSADQEAGDHEAVAYDIPDQTTSENDIQHAEDRLNDEIEELLELLGLSQSMVQVTNEMLTPPEDTWEPPQKYRAIINPGGVGQPRDGDPRAAFMIYDSEACTFTFYRIPYDFEKTQEKIILAGLPQYLAVRLAYGR
ncbi:MAG TPA: metallophosphoesterase family protein [Ktedonobacteraceae bacterium]|nr:metallophosphoesterase family protein [Ktedonobacteraceae bacterium]